MEITFKISAISKGQVVVANEHRICVADIHDNKDWISKIANLAILVMQKNIESSLPEAQIRKDLNDLRDSIKDNIEEQRYFCEENNTILNHIKQQYSAGFTSAVVELWFKDN